MTYLRIRRAYRLLRSALANVSSTEELGGASRRKLDKIYRLSVRLRRQSLYESLRCQLGDSVQAGPFRGMHFPTEDNRHGGDRLSTLPGYYEQELSPVLAELASRTFDCVVDIGAAEGYYAVGFALIMDTPKVIAVDPDASALAVCEFNARANGVWDKIDFAPSSLTVEGIVDRLVDLFEPTHRVTVVEEGGRDPNRFDALRPLSSFDRWLAVSEGRPETMEWICALPKGDRSD